MKKEEWLVYMHTNTINNKRYIGITHHSDDPNKRWKNGLGYKNYGSNQSGHFYNAILKYGWDKFDHQIIKTNLTKEQACALEIELIEKYSTCDRRYGYNAHQGGSGGSPLSDQAKLKISMANSGEKNGMYNIGVKHPMYGKRHTLESRQKMSQALKGRSPWNKGIKMEITEEQRRIIIATHTGNKYNLGRVWNKESRDKLSKSTRKNWENPTYRQRLSDSHKGMQCDYISKPVICEGVKFRTIYECAAFYGVKRETMGTWLNGKRTMPEKFFNMGLRFEDSFIEYAKRPEKRQINGVKVVCDNIVFNSISMCAEFYSASPSSLRRYLSGERKMPQKYIDLGLRYATEEDFKKHKELS